MSLLKKHSKLIIGILLFLPFLVFVDKIVFSYMEPKAKEAANSAEAVQKIYGAKCAMCHGVKGDGMANFPKIAGLTKDEALAKIKAHKEGEFGEVIRLRAELSSLSDAQKEELASFIATLKAR
jgi:cytochrome c553